MTPTESAGLRKYWFNAVEFSAGWFKHHVDLATIALDDRYHPDDHVDVTSQELFEIIARHPRSREKLLASFKAIRALESPGTYFLGVQPGPPADLLAGLVNSVDAILQCEAEVSFPIWKRFGACCAESSRQRLRAYAELAAKTLFDGPTPPPPNLLLRDYGRGIIELADQLGVAPATATASPPHASVPPRLKLTKAAVQKVASAAGDDTILHSCESYGDFGRYTVEDAVRDFTTVKLSHRVPLTAREKLDRFEREVIDPDPRRSPGTKIASSKAIIS